MTDVHHTFCRICESLCGLEVHVDQGEVVRIKPDADHVATRGFACVKGIKQQRMYSTRDRLTQPLKRVGKDFVEISWDEALADIGATVRRLRGDHGPDSLGLYVGTAAGFSILHPIFAQGFMQGIGSSNIFSSATQDCANKFAVAQRIYGFPFTQPFPDLEHVQCLIVTGANPVVSKWSFLQVPNPYLHLHELDKRAAKLFVVDPRRTETAKAAGEHVFIRPNTDVFFFLAFLHELFAIGGVDEARAATYLTGTEALRALVQPWTPERCATVTQMPADTLRRMVRTFHEADGAAMYCSTGVNMGTNGSLAFWLQECINALSGNLDRRGGTLVGQGVFDFAKFGARYGVLTSEGRSRVGGFAKTNDAYPGGVLADEILTEGPGQIRGMFVTGGNPLITMANSERLRGALSKLELLVCVDIQLNETASLATHVLPATSPFQRADLPFVFPLWLGMQTKPYLQATRPVVPPQGNQRDESTIYHDLCRASGVGLFGSKALTASLEGWRRWRRWRRPGQGDGLSNEGLLDGLLRLTGQGRFDALLQHRHGKLREAHAAGSFLGERVVTPDGKVHLDHPDLMAAAAARLSPHFDNELAQAGAIKLITKRALTTHNSWTHNLEDFVPERNRTNLLCMHPTDAAAAGLAEGDIADVSTDVSTVRLPITLLDDLMPGVVALPHGWGHQHAKGLSVASQTDGVNVNLLAADGPEGLEPLSGMAHLTGIVVEVRPAAGPRDTTSWSGIAQAPAP